MVIRIVFTALALALVLYLRWMVDISQWIETATQQNQERTIGHG